MSNILQELEQEIANVSAGVSKTNVGTVREIGDGGAKVEGRSRSDWVLVDSGDIVIHLFRPEVREFYKLEKLWSHDLPETAEASTAVQTA